MGKASRRKPARLAEKLLQIRVKMGLSQNQLIRRMGLEDELEQQYISKFEHAVIEPPLHVLCAYADLINVPLDCLARDYLDLPTVIPTHQKKFGPTTKPRSSRRKSVP
jgi:transcriptional regulator with XRE-family HTH domain